MKAVKTKKNEAEIFTYSYYKEMLLQAIKNDYVITSFERYNHSNKKTILLRHDVDYNLNGVLNLAKIENQLSVTSTFFFRVHANEYNLFSPFVYKLINDLKALGHEIGLHAEPMSFSRSNNMSPEKIIKKEKALMELLFDTSIISISEHRDIGSIIHGTPYLHECYDVKKLGFEFFAMDDEYFKKMKYISDSNGIWRDGDLIEHLGVYNKIQVLVHPEWWSEYDIHLKGPYFHGLGN